MSTLRINDRLSITQGGMRKNATVVDVNGNMAEIKIEGEKNHLFFLFEDDGKGNIRVNSAGKPQWQALGFEFFFSFPRIAP